MKKFLKTILFLCALSSIAYEKEAEEQAKLAEKAAKEEAKLAEEQAKSQVNTMVAPAEAVVATEGMNAQDEKEAMDILDGMRKKLEKEDAETLKIQKEAKELGITTSEASSLAEIEAMVKAKKAEKAKPKTEAEKLEATRKEALEKLDFYERVVRSVAREEAEVAGYYEIMNDEQPKPAETTEAPVAEGVAPVVETTVQQ